MQRDRIYLSDILDAARLAVSYLDGVEMEAYIHNVQLQDSVIRRVEIIGEASRRISEETKAAHPNIPWREMIGMRNFMIHEYDDVDVWVVWETVRYDLPQLITQIASILESGE